MLMSMVQDFKELRDACIATKTAKKDLQKYQEHITSRCEGKVYFTNLFKEQAFYSAVPLIKTKEDFSKLREYAVECRASSCFYKLYEYLGTVVMPIGLKRSYEINPEKVFSCVNVDDKGLIDEVRCGGCPHFEELVKYQMLKSKLAAAQEELQIAKHNLLNNFVFWKHKSK